MSDILLVDIGGTNMRSAYSKLGDDFIYDTNKNSLEDLKNFNSVITDLISNANFDIRNAVFSIAGPKIANNISMTNREFTFDSDKAKKIFNLDQCYLLNDWESIGYSLSSTPENEIELIKDGISFNRNSLIIGPGTGLGAAFNNAGNVLPTEIGNTTNWNDSLLENFSVKDKTNYTKLEDILSGTGIKKLYKSITGQSITPEEVIKRYKADEDSAKEVIDGFIKCLAEVLSDLSLTYIPGNGIYLAGGLIRSLFDLIDPKSFYDDFISNKSSIHQGLLKDIKIGVIKREHSCLYGNLNYFNLLNKTN